MKNELKKKAVPAAERNKKPIADALQSILPGANKVLEVASGTGQHAAYLSGCFPHLSWATSEFDQSQFESIQAYIFDSKSDRIFSPILLDVLDQQLWGVNKFDVLVNINMVHITPREALPGLMRQASACLEDGGWLYMYGPFWENHQPRLPGNLSFDQRLREMDSRFGIWELDEVQKIAMGHGMHLERKLAMPANNLSVFFRKLAT